MTAPDIIKTAPRFALSRLSGLQVLREYGIVFSFAALFVR